MNGGTMMIHPKMIGHQRAHRADRLTVFEPTEFVVHPVVPIARGGRTLSDLVTWDRNCKLYGWPQTFVGLRRG